MIQGPCLDCKDREIGCHDHCNKYQEYRDIVDKANAKRRLESQLDGYTLDTMKRFRKKRNSRYHKDIP